MKVDTSRSPRHPAGGAGDRGEPSPFSPGAMCCMGGPDALEGESSLIAQRSVVAAVWGKASVKARFGRLKSGEKLVGWADLDGIERFQG
ncbi:MAG: hypothetical protein OXF50_24270 [Caldilineaceae bacterium]|nr:hypothetical protein [Caldilineaceae bacterium]